MDTNFKYSKKIRNFIDNNLHNFNNIINPLIQNINPKLFNDITSIIISTYKENYNDYKKQYNYHLPKIHEINQYPLMFIFLCKLYEHGILDNTINPINLSSFNHFVSWFRYNHSSIDIDHIHNIINKLDKVKYHDLIQLYLLIYKTNNIRSNLHELLYNNPFVSLDIQHHAESIDMQNSIYITNHFTLIIYYPVDNHKKLFNINKIFHIINFMNELGKLNNSIEKPNICIFAGLQRKQFTNDTEHILCPNNINSGSSLRGISINIWRIEEIYKVLIHELIHFHRLDFHSDNAIDLGRYLINTYNIKGIDCPNESYTETLAIIIHSLFISFYNHINIKDVLKYEIIFTLLQISKILRYYDISSSEELGYKQFNQNTSVFSYFIVKGSFLISLPTFLNFVNNDISNLSIENKIDTFSILIKNCMNKKYFNLINLMINNLLNILNLNTINEKNFVIQTLRMTCF